MRIYAYNNFENPSAFITTNGKTRNKKDTESRKTKKIWRVEKQKRYGE
ncbi:hypothetical protein [Methanosarcina sp. KYL-1]|nr:hypothetical protein [Methanosarcina sp. KYL-1]